MGLFIHFIIDEHVIHICHLYLSYWASSQINRQPIYFIVNGSEIPFISDLGAEANSHFFLACRHHLLLNQENNLHRLYASITFVQLKGWPNCAKKITS
jgi:hypothetical protein